MYNNELSHHGIKGMKWGRRRFQNADGSLTPAGVKRYATKGFTEDSYRSNKTAIGRAYDLYTGAHKLDGKMTYQLNKKLGNNAANEERAKKFVEDGEKIKAERDAKKNASKQAKADYKKRTDDAWSEYEKTILDIEKPYKRGQNLSEKDQAREAAAEKKYNDAVAKAKAEYKAIKNPNNKPLTAEQKAENRKRAVKLGVAVVGTAVAAYGAYKLNKYVKDKNTQIAMERANAYINEKKWQTYKDVVKNYNSTGKAHDISKVWETYTKSNNEFAKEVREVARQEAASTKFVDAAKNVYNYNKNEKLRKKNLIKTLTR